MIRNIWAVGRNYAHHAKELGNKVPTEPLIFLKAGSCAIFGPEIQLPVWTQEVHHEVELALKFDDNLEFESFGVALDLTERRMQNHLKAQGSPWTLAKSFQNSCPISQFHPIKNLNDLAAISISLEINGSVKQSGNTRDMIFPLERLKQFIKFHFPVCPGDLLLTGTPAGVGPIQRGDKLTARLGDQIVHHWNVV
jgi:2-keto-4-pentenoate hydratase/2-oxohepta-3-ene-1,7-dioic acid hydratase in catechol pathway